MFEGSRLETCAGDDGPVVVKTATDEGGRARLEREAERLEHARHPGVVHLVSADEGRLVLAWAGDQTLALLRPTVAASAALLAAIASTVADLHELGIIHGRLEPSHVIVGADGRPRLCGLAGRDPAERPATPADDVAALGHLIDHLLGPGAELEPIPDRRWARRRPVTHDRRALLAVADRAAQEDPAQRPTARALALLIVDAVPSARLDRPSPRSAPPDPLPEPAATAAPEPDQPEPGPLLPEPAPAVVLAEAIDHPAPGPDRAETAAEDRTLDRTADTDTDTDTDTDGSTPVETRFLGLRVEPARPDQPGRPAARPVRSAPTPTRPGLDRVPRVMAAALAVVAGLVIASTGGWLRVGPPSAAPTTAIPPTTARAPASTTSRPGPTTVACPAAAGPATDRDGDGCPEPYRVEGTTILVDGQRWTVGQAGDQVELGDWDCDGRATPGVLRPGTGEVFLFPRWPGGEQPLTVEPAALLAGAQRFVPRPPATGCGPPRVVLADGREVAVAAGAVRP